MERGWAGAAQCVAASVRLRISGWRGMVAASARWWGLGLEGGPPAGAAVRRWLRRAEIFLGFTPIGNGEAFCTGSLVGGFVNALSASMWCGWVNTGNRSRGSLSGITLVLILVTPRGATSFLKAMSYISSYLCTRR